MSTTGYNGRELTIGIGSPEVTIAAIQTKTVTSARSEVDVTTDDSAGFRTLLPEPGVKSKDISGDNYNDIISYWYGTTLLDVTVTHADGTTESGDFFCQNIEFSGEHDGNVAFSITLLSSGEITKVDAT